MTAQREPLPSIRHLAEQLGVDVADVENDPSSRELQRQIADAALWEAVRRFNRRLREEKQGRSLLGLTF